MLIPTIYFGDSMCELCSYTDDEKVKVVRDSIRLGRAAHRYDRSFAYSFCEDACSLLYAQPKLVSVATLLCFHGYTATESITDSVLDTVAAEVYIELWERALLYIDAELLSQQFESQYRLEHPEE